jgi:ATP-dependent helicase/DNAse subunit B
MSLDSKLPKKNLSASRIKTLQTCSWKYWCDYHLHVPQTPNDGASRGTVCHLVFELLLNPRHRKHYDAIVKADSVRGSRAIYRLVAKHLKKYNLFDVVNYKLVDEMILVGLRYDFFCNGAEMLESEYAFEISNEDPPFKLTGFIDKRAFYKKQGIVKITDYKSSKYKFRGDDLESNIQALVYSLAAKKLWPDLKPVIEFLFLRFPRSPIQTLSFSDAQIRGFARSLEEIHKIVDNFNEDTAKSNFAADSSTNSWLCQRGNYKCPFKDPFTYYVLLDEEGKTRQTSFTNNLVPNDKQKVLVKHYDGCPRHKKPEKSKGSFGF